MKIEFLKVPIVIHKVENHNEIKQNILDSIEKMGKYSNIVPGYNSISNTDWHLSSGLFRPYFKLVEPIIKNNSFILKESLKLDCDLTLGNYWFQQYENGDYHGWHNHFDTYYSSVYYVELPKDSVKTTFKVIDNEYEFEVSEGDILSFPSHLYHESKVNKSNKRKTIISFNLNCEWKLPFD